MSDVTNPGRRESHNRSDAPVSPSMALLRTVLDGSSTVELAQEPEPHGQPLPSKQDKKPGKKPEKKPSKEQPKGKHQLPPGAVGWKHNWVPVDENGRPVGPSQKDKSAAEIKDMAGHTDATKAAIAQAYKNKAVDDGKKAAVKAKSNARKAEADKKRAAATKKREAAAAKREAARKAATKKREARAKAVAARRAAAKKAAAKKAKETARRKLVTAAIKQALADKKSGRPLTPTQVRLLDHYEAQQAEQTDNLRNNVSLSQPVEAGQVTVPTGSSQDGARLTVNSLTTKYPKRYLADAAIKAQKKRRAKGKKCL